MSQILQNFAEPALMLAVEANFAEEMAVFGRYLPEAELHDDEEIEWFITGLLYPLFNGVLRTHFTTGVAGKTEDIDRKIDAILSHFKARRIPMDWAVNQASQPANLGAYLEAHGLSYLGANTAMVLDMRAMHVDLPTHPNLKIEEINDLETLKLWRNVSDKGFGSSGDHAKVYFDAYVNMGLGPHLPWHHYIGWLNDEPVAVSSLLLYAGVAGIYGVATIPEARRQGIGAAMTLEPLNKARSLGYCVAMLSPSDFGLVVYQRIGFREYSKTSFYRWSL